MKAITIESRVAVDSTIDEDDKGDKILMGLLDIVQSIGHDDIPFYLDWSDDINQLYKDYLVRTYGEDIKKYEDFILKCY